MIRVASFILLLGSTLVVAQCPNVHIFGARETTAPPGYGTAGSVVSSIISAFPGATGEVINYPACGGQSSCGGASYASSATQGVAAVASQVNAFNTKCPNSVLVLVGYSQGGQIMDDAYCGGGDTNEGITNTAIPISAAAQKKIAAAILMGDPRHIPGLSFNVGTCQASGFAPRPAGFQCPYASNIQSYCDAADPYCCNGSDANTHQGYAVEYGSVALTFVKNKVNALLNGTAPPTGPPTTTTTTGGSAPTQPSGGTVPHWGQCGGQGWTGGTVCQAPFTCQAANAFVSVLRRTHKAPSSLAVKNNTEDHYSDSTQAGMFI
ncbi:putative acetyl xylan esterase [Mycena filopes]|nr:putative acetyl xylan esterase [Mycena filopes]